MSNKPSNFDQYYEYYLSLHQNKWCRRLHVLGQLFTIAYIVFSIKTSLWLLIASPFVVYPFAWSGHYFFEKNEPAAARAPSNQLLFRFSPYLAGLCVFVATVPVVFTYKAYELNCTLHA